MEIEQIKPIGKKNERFYIMLSSGEKVVLHGLTLLKTKLKVGDDINKETLEEYQFEYEKLTAFDKAINLLSRGMKTKKQSRHNRVGSKRDQLLIKRLLKKVCRLLHIVTLKELDNTLVAKRCKLGINRKLSKHLCTVLLR